MPGPTTTPPRSFTNIAARAAVALSCWSFSGNGRAFDSETPPHADRPAATATEPGALPALEVVSGDRLAEAKARVENGSDALISTVEDRALDVDNPTNTGSTTRKWICLLAGLTAGVLGYLRYANGSCPPTERDRYRWSRWGSKLFPDQGYVKGDHTAMQNWTVINGVNVIVGLATALTQSGEVGLATLAPLVAPAGFFAGCVGCLSITSKDGTRDTHPLLRACAYASYGALAIFVGTKLHLLSAITPLSPEALSGTAIVAAVSARTLGLVGFAWRYIHAAIAKEAAFPQMMNMGLWTMATAFGVAAISTPLTQAAWVPLGYFIQNIGVMAIAGASYLAWSARVAGKNS